VNIRKALTFVQEHGDTLARARGAALMEKAAPTPEILAEVERLLGTGRIVDACQALLALQDLGLGSHPLAQRGLQSLLARQEEDGSWFDAAAGEPAPRWLSQGEEAGRLYLSARVGALLVAYGRAEEPAADRVLDLLLKHQLEGGTFVGFPRESSWHALPLLARKLGRSSGPAQNILFTLSQELAEPGWTPAMFAEMLRNLLTAGYTMETPLVRASWEQLLMRQGEDGAWASEGGDDVQSTLDVLWCWKRIVLK
jgi:hypothetical protein